jgi:NDP-hexose-3-ketoreductase
VRALRVAVWGLGRHAVEKILPAISIVDGLELYGVCSRNVNTVSSSANEWNCLGWIDPTIMLCDPRVDIIYVATPIGLHFQHGKQVLDAKKHLWCEKPLTCNLQDTLELLNIAENNELSICEGLMFLYHPHYQNLIHYVKGSQLGKILSIDSKFGIPRLENESFRTNSSLGGGAFFDVGCYTVAAILSLFPKAEARLIYAKICMSTDSTVDTSGQALVNLSNGVNANLEWRINCSYRNEINIWGENGSLFTAKIFSKQSDYSPLFFLKDMKGIELLEHGLVGDQFQLMFKDFLGTIYEIRKAEIERIQIVRRAVLMDQIWALGRL